MVEIIVALIAGVAALGGAAMPYLAPKMGGKNSKPVLPTGPCNQVLILGIGRTGKTQLIKTFKNDADPVSREVTRNITVHDISQPEHYTLIDYRGQENGQIIDMFDSKTDPRIFKGSVNSIVFVVDLFAPANADYLDPHQTKEREDQERDRKYPQVDSDRVRQNLNTWNTAMLDLVIRHVPTPSLRGICLFINKADKWSNWDHDCQNAQLKSNYQGLVDELHSRCAASQNVEFVVIVGSTYTGAGMTGANGLIATLKNWCVRQESN